MDQITTYYFTQGVLGFSVVVLGLVVIYLQRKLDRKDGEHKAELKTLNELLVATIQAHAGDYKEMAKDYQETTASTGQVIALFGEKIEVAKGRRS